MTDLAWNCLVPQVEAHQQHQTDSHPADPTSIAAKAFVPTAREPDRLPPPTPSRPTHPTR